MFLKCPELLQYKMLAWWLIITSYSKFRPKSDTVFSSPKITMGPTCTKGMLIASVLCLATASSLVQIIPVTRMNTVQHAKDELRAFLITEFLREHLQ